MVVQKSVKTGFLDNFFIFIKRFVYNFLDNHYAFEHNHYKITINHSENSLDHYEIELNHYFIQLMEKKGANQHKNKRTPQNGGVLSLWRKGTIFSSTSFFIWFNP
ncbi:hypothetical protein, partial [Bacillus sp. ISL-37]|uniref:hypothetical protein n=1 Tax=Bacillus sp. ISL-37 TaxID=2819123 RepID=UPI001BEB958C